MSLSAEADENNTADMKALTPGPSVRKQRGHAFSLDHVWWRVRGPAHPMRTYRRQYEVCVGRVSEARRAPLDW